MKNIEILHPKGQSFFDEKTAPKVLASGFKFIDGIVWHPDGYLLFSDTAANKIFQVYVNGVMHVMLHNSGGPCITFTHLSELTGSGGLAVDKQKNLVFCQQGSHGIAKLDKGKNLVQLCSSYNGAPFNSPNNLAINGEGAIYFTNPPYGLKDHVLNTEFFQPASGIYRFKNNMVSRLAADLKYPKGICFSNNEQQLFVSSNNADEKMILKYDLNDEGLLQNKTVFAEINAGSIKNDQWDNMYAATREGLLILSPEGKKLALINLSQMATSVAFGGSQNDILFIATASTIYQVQLNYKLPEKALGDRDEVLKKSTAALAVTY